MNVYLDYAATTPLDPRVLEAMLPYLQEGFGNPSSLHRTGQRARDAVESARERVALAIGATSREIIFTSGATEADNHALRAMAQKYPDGQVITSVLEHSAVRVSAKYLQQQGYDVCFLTPDERGEITPDALQEAISEKTTLVALMMVNNETGVVSDIAALSRVARAHGAAFFCDAVQAFAYLPIDVQTLGVDMLSLSAHKIAGPKGVGALFVRRPFELPPFMLGGEQERGQRAGTLNVPAIVGLGKAAELARAELAARVEKVSALRDRLQAQLLKLEGVVCNAEGAPRSAKHLNVRIAGVDGEDVLMGLDAAGVAASAGSACAAGSLEPSPVLLAMGLTPADAKASVRLTLGEGLSEQDIDFAAQAFAEVIARCRQ